VQAHPVLGTPIEPLNLLPTVGTAMTFLTRPGRARVLLPVGASDRGSMPLALLLVMFVLISSVVITSVVTWQVAGDRAEVVTREAGWTMESVLARAGQVVGVTDAALSGLPQVVGDWKIDPITGAGYRWWAEAPSQVIDGQLGTEALADPSAGTLKVYAQVLPTGFNDPDLAYTSAALFTWDRAVSRWLLMETIDVVDNPVPPTGAVDTDFSMLVDYPTVTFVPSAPTRTITPTLDVTAGTPAPPYSYTVLSGTLPASMALNPSTGALTGPAPTAWGANGSTTPAGLPTTIVVQVTDARGRTASTSVLLGVQAFALELTYPEVEFTSTAPGAVFSPTLQVTGTGAGPYTYSLASGVLPASVSLNPATGSITAPDAAAWAAATGGGGAISVSAAVDHSCAVAATALVYCWGANGVGQLGDGTITGKLSPVAVNAAAMGPVSSVVTANSYTCALTTASTVYCWGYNPSGLGDGPEAAQRLTPARVDAAGQMGPVAALSAGGSHTCALTTAGAVFCWGSNINGQLGTGDTVSRPEPAAVTFPAGAGPIAQVSGGINHTCAVTTAGVGYCWGNNTNSRLGDGTTTQRLVPTPITVPAGMGAVAQINGGSAHSCAVTVAGVGYCWGVNTNSRLGDGSTVTRSVPTPISVPDGMGALTQISAGLTHSCAVSAAGAGYCWGSNAGGRLGDGTTVNRSVPTPIFVPAGMGDVTAISAGEAHNCALSSPAGPYCWGVNTSGRLGDGTTVNRSAPTEVTLPAPAVPIPAGLPTTITVRVTDAYGRTTTTVVPLSAVAAAPVSVELAYPEITLQPSAPQAVFTPTLTVTGGQTTAPVTYAITSGTLPASMSFSTATGALTGPGATAWGANGTTTPAGLPVTLGIRVTDGSGATDTVSVTVGVAAFSVDLTYPAVQVSETAPGATFTPTLTVSGTPATPYTYAIISGTLPASMSLNTSTGVLTAPNAGAWSGGIPPGFPATVVIRATDAYGRTTSTSVSITAQTPFAMTLAYPSVAFSPAAPPATISPTLTATGTEAPPYTFALASGTLPASVSLNTTTGAVTGPPASAWDLGTTKITAGGSHTCAVTTAGAGYCWGLNTNGRLGDASTTTRPTPALVAGGHTWAQITAGGSHTCGVTTAGAGYCWGLNTNGQLGTGNTTQSTSPALIAGGRTWAQVSAGTSHTCGVTTAGAVFCWGLNTNGRLGDASTTQRTSPVAVTLPGSATAAGITTGDAHSCAVSTAGAVACWGLNSTGQLGDASVTQRTSPVTTAVPAAVVATQVSAGANFTCALSAAGTMYCWGTNASGQLGTGNTTQSTSPVLAQLPGSVTAVSLGTGSSHTCATSDAGTVYCWGLNSASQLGDGTTTARSTPAAVTMPAGAGPINTIAGGTSHTCTISATGATYCWGTGTSGQVGDGASTTRTTPVTVSGLGGPTTPPAGLPTTVVLRATDTLARTTSTSVPLGVEDFALNLTYPAISMTNTNPSVTFTPTLSVTGTAAGPYTYTVASGVLPASMALNPTTGVLTAPNAAAWSAGLPTGLPTTIRVRVTDTYGRSGTVPVTLAASAPVASIALAYPDVVVDQGAPQSTFAPDLQTTGTTAPYTYTVASGVLPASMTLNSATGVLSGPTQADWYATAQISAGGGTCAVTEARGAVYCWGDNYFGLHGDGTSVDKPDLVPVSGLTSGVAQVSVGSSHACAVTTAGAAWCWGNNSNGQLGDGTLTTRLTPVQVSGLASGVASISAGNSHTCAMTTSGAALCWGANASRQLGDNTTVQKLIPTQVSGLASGVAQVSAGTSHSCAVTTAGAAWCWGANTNGRLGNNSVTASAIPVQVSGLTSGTAQISAGNGHTCAVTTAGAALCWGNNVNGQLGDGTTTQQLIPTQVSGRTSGTAQISADWAGTCAVTTAGAAWCWGSNDRGQLGDGTLVQRLVPVQVSGLGSGVTSISASSGHTCAVAAAKATRCWGDNYLSQLGFGSDVDRSFPTPAPIRPFGIAGLQTSVVIRVADAQGRDASTTVAIGVSPFDKTVTYPAMDLEVGAPQPTFTPTVTGAGSTAAPYTYSVLAGNLPASMSLNPTTGAITGPAAAAWPEQTLTQISAGPSHSCEVSAAGAVLCWGYNADGRLGDGTPEERFTPTQVSGLTSGFTQVGTGIAHSCAVTAAGAVWCWGANNNGQLGDGTTTASLVPVQVSGLASGTASISVGASHTCAVTTAGAALCWGMNVNGRLGDNTTTTKLVPTPVSNLTSGVAQISAGGAHTCAVTTAGAAWCWGNNTNGQLGDNSTVQKLIPTQVSGLASGVAQIDSGNAYTCAVTTAGAARCWGLNTNGQLGDNTTTQQLIPVQVSGLTSGTAQIDSGTSHTCAVTTAGAALCWGSGANGRLGDNTTVQKLVPTPVSGLASGVDSISVGTSHACAVMTTSGAGRCWGSGRLGDGSGTQKLIPTPVAPFGPLGIPALLAINVTDAFGRTTVAAADLRVAPFSMTLTYPSIVLSPANGSSVFAATVDVLGTPAPPYTYTVVGGTLPASMSLDPATGAITAPSQAAWTSPVVTEVATGSTHTCVLTAGGDVYCWGANASGQLGDGTTTARTAPVKVTGLGGPASDITVGANHTCAVVEGAGRCWGLNTNGQLGNNSTTASSVPVSVGGTLNTGLTQIEAGTSHTCAIKSGAPWCWGLNTNGQLGDNTTVQKLLPVNSRTGSQANTAITSGTTSIGTGANHTCAVTSGIARCWGGNVDGQLGIGGTTTANYLTATAVSPAVPNTPVQITAGTAQTCATNSLGAAYCWGLNTNGQVGDGSTTTRRSPALVTGFTSGVSAISAGNGQACAVRDAGAWCWGNNVNGQLGNATSGAGNQSTTPVQVSGMTADVTAVGAGSSYSCAVRDEAGYCWGINTGGVLGDGTTTQRTIPVAVTGYPASTPAGLPTTVIIRVTDTFGRVTSTSVNLTV
jgi:alpha-tubulin suppressor-like RCC1 family protein